MNTGIIVIIVHELVSYAKWLQYYILSAKHLGEIYNSLVITRVNNIPFPK